MAVENNTPRPAYRNYADSPLATAPTPTPTQAPLQMAEAGVVSSADIVKALTAPGPRGPEPAANPQATVEQLQQLDPAKANLADIKRLSEMQAARRAQQQMRPQ